MDDFVSLLYIYTFTGEPCHVWHFCFLRSEHHTRLSVYRRRRAGQQLHLHRLGHRLFDLRLEHITGNRFRFNCTDGTPGHSLYNENTFEYNGIAVLLKSVPSDPAPDFQNSVFPGNDTDIRLSPGGWAHRESQGVRPGILSKSRLVFYGTLPNFL